MATPETLVGRAAELAAVDAALGGALEGRTTTLLVAGEAGIGKTRLLEHLARLAGARAVPVLWGRATDDDGAPAYWPWRQVLRSLASGAGAQAVEALGPEGTELSRIAPELAGAAPPPPAVAGEVGAGERFALFEVCRALLEGTASRAGLVVVLDDLHWCDAASLLLLSHVVRHARDARLLVAGAFRSHDLARAPRAADIVAAISGQPSTVRLDLGGLAAGEVGEQLAGVMGRPVSADVVATVAMRTGGNPLFVREVGRLLASGSQGVPDAVRGAIGQRLGALDGGCRRTLAAAAVVGVDIDPHLVAAATGGVLEEVLGHLDEALAAGILARRPASLRYRFAHDLVRDCCALDLAGAERARVHLATAEHLAGPGGDGHPAEVAHHRLAALPWGDPGAASAAARRAAAVALGQLAFEDAARLYGWALEAASAAGAGAGGRARLLVDRGHAHHLANDSAAARAACEQAAGLAEEAGDAEALGLAALVLEDTSEPEWLVTIQRWCRSALAGLGDADSALRAQLRAQEAMTWLAAGDASRMEGASMEALAMAERVGDRAALATALRARQLARSSPDGALERLELADRMRALGARPPDHGCAAVWGHLWRFDALMELGRVDEAEAELHRLEPVVARSRQPLARWHLLRSLTAVHIGRGRFAEAVAVNAEALAIARAGGYDGAVGTTRAQRALVSVLTGDRIEDLGAELRRALPGPWQPMVLALAAEWYLVSGRPDEAARLYRSLPPPTWRPPPFLALPYCFYRGVLAAAIGDRDGAEVAYRALLPHAGLHLAGGAGVIVTRGSVERVLGVTAAACGRLDAAVAHLRRAVEANEGSGLPPCVAEAGCELAEVLMVRDGPGDRAGAARAATKAAAIAERLGMRPVAARCHALDRELGDGGGPLSPREREIAGLVARGLTNRQIAVQLHIGHRTAENHVQHILTKLGFNTRSQVAAWVTANRPPG